MGLWDKKNREDPEESGKRSMLYSLWYRMKACGGYYSRSERGDVIWEESGCPEGAEARTLIW